MSNPWEEFRRLLPKSPVMIGTVASLNADGTTTITTPQGGSVVVQGQGVAVDHRAFYQFGRIAGEAPELDAFETEV